MKTNIEDEEDSDEEDSEFDYDETALGNFINKMLLLFRKHMYFRNYFYSRIVYYTFGRRGHFAR